MRLYVEPMDAVLVDANSEGLVRFEHEDWVRPTLQEQRAIVYAAGREIDALTELVDVLGKQQEP